MCGDLGQAERREWWLANGLGGYAGGTIAGSLTRRYHGLLVAPVAPPLGRRLILAKADATLVGPDVDVPLFSNRWTGGVVSPLGTPGIESFKLDRGVPVWTFMAAGRRIEGRVWMEAGANTTYVAWRLVPDGFGAVADGAWRLRVILLANDRDHHGDATACAFDPAITGGGDRLLVADPGRFTLTIAAPGGRIAPRRDWYPNFVLAAEAERGLGSVDNHLCVGVLDLPLREGVCAGFVASLEPRPDPDLDAALARRLAHGEAVAAAAACVPEMAGAPAWIARLAQAADSFVFARPLPDVPDGLSVIAGYPWFGDWGRDTMISLPGLSLATGRPEEARRILTTFSRFVDRGMLPNVFPDSGGSAEYNTADAALWFFEAWRAYHDATGDTATLRQVYPVLSGMIGWHVKGTRYGIGVDPADGLLRAGVPGVQVTWMDARVDGRVITPRIGKPVEINALWYNALRAMAGFARMLGEPDTFTAAADRVQAAFARFVRPGGQGLCDVIDGPDGDDAALRPNQIFAVSLPHPPLGRADAEAVVAVCRRHLLTSYGMRSLAPGSPGYGGVYAGGVAERDGHYHQGPVWGWLLGHYALAVFRVTGDAETAQALLAPMREALRDGGIGTIGEIFDGDPPHRPRGAPSQAWSVASTLDAWVRLERAKRAVGAPAPAAIAH